VYAVYRGGQAVMQNPRKGSCRLGMMAIVVMQACMRGGGYGAEVLVAVSRFSSHPIMDPADLDQNLFANSYPVRTVLSESSSIKSREKIHLSKKRKFPFKVRPLSYT
jgi:hypothetical protein